MNRKQLLPLYVRKRLPSIEEVANKGMDELVAQVKFFYPDFGWTWYGIAWDGVDRFFGLVDGFEVELGDFLLSELMANRGKLGCAIERDRWFKPTSVRTLWESLQARCSGSADEALAVGEK